MGEQQLYQSIDNRIDKFIHRQSMTGAAKTFNGTPDRYYDGALDDLWVEYKQLVSMPRDNYVRVAPIDGVKRQPNGRLTALQLNWLTRRWWNASSTHNAIVVVGLPNKTALLLRTPSEWNGAVSIFESRTYAEVSKWIQDFCGALSSQR